MLRAMIEQLRTFAPTADRDGKMTQEWLSDWSTYIGDREDYASRLSTDSSARFYEFMKSSATEQISKPIDRFAYVNNMDDCNTPRTCPDAVRSPGAPRRFAPTAPDEVRNSARISFRAPVEAP